MNFTVTENILFLLLFSGTTVHTLYLSFLLFIKSMRQPGLNWLGALMLPIAALLINFLLYTAGLMQYTPHLLGVLAPVIYLMGPFYFFFVRKSIDSNYQLRKYDLAHLIPSLYIFWSNYPLYLLTVQEKLSIINTAFSEVSAPVVQVFFANQRELIILGYVFSSYFILKKKLDNGGSVSDVSRVQWLLKFTLVFAAVLVAKIILVLLSWTFQLQGVFLETSLILIIATCIHILGYVVLGKDQVLPERIRIKENGKYVTSPLNAKQIEIYKQDIILFLEEKRLWLNSDFSVEDFSRELDIPRHYVSQVLNEGLKLSFYDLICHYRIEEVKKRLRTGEAEEFSIQGIAADCGFKSKSSFHRAFKKETGITPGNYLKELRRENPHP